MRQLDFKAAAATVVEAVASTAEKAGILRQAPKKPKSRDAAEELQRRAAINAEGARRRAGFEAAIFGRATGPWIEPRPDWLKRRGM